MSETIHNPAHPLAHKRSQRQRVNAMLSRYSAAQLLIALVLLIIVAPFLDSHTNGARFEVVLMTLVFASAARAVGRGPKVLLMNALLAALAIIGAWVRHIWPELVPAHFPIAAELVFVVFVSLNILHFILGAPRVNPEVLCAAVATFLLLGVLWSLSYMLVDLTIPNSFGFNNASDLNQQMQGFTAFYFSFCTLTTLGYGDITPVSEVARMLAMLESMTGMLYVAVLIARLVAMYSASANAEKN